MEKIKMACPFCENQIDVIFTEGTVSSKLKGNSTKKIRYFINHPDKYEVLEDCSNCHKSKSEIQKALEQGVTKTKSKEELKKQLEELGLSGRMSIVENKITGRNRRGRFKFRE